MNRACKLEFDHSVTTYGAIKLVLSCRCTAVVAVQVTGQLVQYWINCDASQSKVCNFNHTILYNIAL